MTNLENLISDLPALRSWHKRMLTHGGPNPYAKTSRYSKKSVEKFERPDGSTGYASKTVDAQKRYSTPYDVANSSTTLSLVRAMKHAGWSQDQAETVLYHRDAVGGSWFRELWSGHDDNVDGRECVSTWLSRAWKLADEELPPRKPAKRSDREFVSCPADQRNVYKFIKTNPGLGRNEIVKAGGGLSGSHTDGRIKLALKCLVESGRIGYEVGPRRKHSYDITEPVAVEDQESSSSTTTNVMPQWMYENPRTMPQSGHWGEFGFSGRRTLRLQ